MIKIGSRHKVTNAVGLNRSRAINDGRSKSKQGDLLTVSGFHQHMVEFKNRNFRLRVDQLFKYTTPVPVRIYLAHPISNTYEAEASIATANHLRALGFEVYAAAENSAINDKTNDPTPMDIYNADIEQLEACDIVVVNITGGDQDGTIFEMGYACALGKKILGYTTNSRLRNPQIYKGIPSAKANHLVIGGVAVKGEWCGTFDGVLEELGK